MPKAIAGVSTFLKARLVGSEDLDESEKIFIEEGKEFWVTDFAPDRNQHLQLTLASTVKAMDGKADLQKVYAYDPHIQIEGEEAKQVIKLPVEYRSQLNNRTQFFGPGWRQCNTTSCAMLADFLLKGELMKQAQTRNLNPCEPESVYMEHVQKYGDTVDHLAQTKGLQEIGIDSYFTTNLSAGDLISSLKAGIPVVVGVKYKTDGHIILVVGHDPNKKIWFVHDPYGSRHGASNTYDIGVGGVFDVYSYDLFDRIYFDLGDEKGYGRIVTAVKGEPTGLPKGL